MARLFDPASRPSRATAVPANPMTSSEMTIHTTATESVPAEDEPAGPQLRLRIWPIVAVVAMITTGKLGTPASKAGIHPGDVVTAVDGTAVATEADARKLLGAHHPGDTATIRFANREAAVTLAANPDDRTRGFLGVTLQT